MTPTPTRQADRLPDPAREGAARRAGPQPLSLRVNFSWSLVGNVVYAASQWGMVVVIAKLGTPEMVGQFALAFAIAAPVFMFTNLALRSVQVTDAAHAYRFGEYLVLRLAMTALGLATVAGLLLVTDYERSIVLVTALVGVAKASESLSDICYGLMQQRERMDLIARSLVLKGLGSLGAVTSILALTGSLVLAVAGLAASWLLLFAAFDLRRTRLFDTSERPGGGTRAVRPGRLRRLAVLALPLGLAMMLISLNSSIPRYFIEEALGERALGFYSALAYLVIGGATVVHALGQSASPRLAQTYAAGDRRGFARLLGRLVALTLAFGCAGWLGAFLLGRPILGAVYTPEYAAYAPLFTALMGVAVLWYATDLLGYGLTAMRAFKVQLPILAVSTAANALLCAWLLPRLGLVGAVWALLAYAVLYLLLSSVVFARGLRGR